MSTAEILDRVLDPCTECLTAEAAQKIVDFHPDQETKSRIDDLAAKATARLMQMNTVRRFRLRTRSLSDGEM